MKKILIIFLILLSVFVIFIFTKDNKINYLSIGDTMSIGITSYNNNGNGYNDYVKNYLRRNDMLRSFNNNYYNSSIIGFTNDILNNKTIIINDEEYTIKKMMRESDLLVIGIGMDELSYIFSDNVDKTRQEFDKLLVNLNDLMKIVREYAKNEIVFIGYYNPISKYNSDIDELFYYIEDSLKETLTKYDIDYISLYEKVKNSNYLDNAKSYHLNSRGYLMIANEIINYIDKIIK